MLAACGDESDSNPSNPSTSVAASDATPTASAAAGTGSASTQQAKGDSVLLALNEARAAGGRCGSVSFAPSSPLRLQADAVEAAAAQTNWMKSSGVLSHAGEANSNVGDRLTAAGYQWNTVGENIAAGQSSPADVVQAWLSSPGHCANILSAAFVDAGFAFVPAGDGATSYATLVLAHGQAVAQVAQVSDAK